MMGAAFLGALLALAASPAFAGPVATAISAIVGAFSSSAVLMVLGRVLLFAAIAAYQQRRMKKAMQRQQGIKTQYTNVGGVTPLSVIVGRYATAGQLEAPQNSQPANSSPPQKYLTYVIGLSDMPITGLTGRVVINDSWHSFSSTPTSGLEDYGMTVEGDLADVCWFRLNDGTQTAADPFLTGKFGADPERPWTADMIGRGIAHVVATFKRDQEKLPGEPRLRFEVLGLKLYDPRKDSTVGGSGAHRWADPATWEFSANPKVIEYNILRGLRIDGYGVWGGNAPASALPLDNWFAAMNACDLPVDDGNGGVEPAFEFGFEFGLDQEPAEIIDEINRSCSGETVEIAGVYKTRVGAIGLPVFFFEDGDVIVSRPRELAPFQSLDQTFNALTCSFPDPDVLWEAREAPPLTNSAWEEEDGLIAWDEATGQFIVQPRRLLREISLPGVANPRQVQRVMATEAARSRRQKSHGLTLPPQALALEPLDAVAWTSAHNGYANKVFEVVMVADPVQELRPRVGLLEADPNDDTPPAYIPLPTPSMLDGGIAGVTVTGFSVAAVTLLDATGAARRADLQITWNGAEAADLRAIFWEVRLKATGAQVNAGTTQATATGAQRVVGLLPATEFEVRLTPITDRPAIPTAWLPVTTPDVRLTDADLSDAVQAALADAVAARGEAEALVDAALVEAQGYADQALADAGALVDDLRAQTTADLAAEIPRLIGAEAAIDGLATQVAWLAARGADQDRQLSEAGLFIDPSTGRARLEAVTRIDGQITEASVRLDAIEGALTLKVTQADVDLAIAAAVLDPSQIPAFTGLEGRITDLEVSLDAAEAAITQRATQVDFDALAVDVTTAETRIDALEAEIVQRVETASFDLLETRVSTAEVTLAALDGAGLTIQISDLRARVDGAEGLADATLAALVEGHDEAVARLADAAVIRQEYHALVDDERVARASLRTELGAAIDTNTAQIVQEVAARADADAALATEISSLTATVSGNAAAITAEATARADQDAALAGQITTVSAVANGRNRVFRQATAPTAEATGDLWFDSDDGNRPYRWSGTAWEGVADDRIAANAAAITSEVAARATADGALAARLDSVEATSGANTAAISAEEVARADADAALSTQISTVSAVANGRNRTFRQGTAPAGPVTGDIWIDSAAGNLMKRWSGSAWVAVDDTRIAGTAAAVTSEATARADADTALGARIDTVEAAAADNAAAITAEAVARADQDGALAGRLDTVEATAADNAAAITAEATARADQDGVLASQITTVSAAASRVRTFYQGTAPASPQIGDIWFDTSANNRARRYGAGGVWVDTSDTRIAANAAAITTESTARATADGALADQISTVSARADGLEASVSTQATALADVQGNLAASLTLRARAGGAEGEIEVVAADDPTGTPLSSVVIRSDRFRFEGDLAEFLGTVRITSAVIDDLTVQRSNIAPGIVTSFDYIQNPISYAGTGPNGVEELLGTQDIVFDSDPNLVPERVVLRPRISGFLPVLGTSGAGSISYYYKMVIKRTRGGVVTTLRDYIEPFWQLTRSTAAVTSVYYAGRPPSAVVTITQPSFLPGDTLTVEYYAYRAFSGTVTSSVAITSYDLEVEEYYR